MEWFFHFTLKDYYCLYCIGSLFLHKSSKLELKWLIKITSIEFSNQVKCKLVSSL